ncbi:hypothetical protein N9X63_04040 [Woeseiaceae bacterium]|nr:hypothetical protein [Woeseiaceae bacterium]
MKKLLLIALLFHSSISFSKRTDCEAIYPPPVTTTHKLIDGYLFTYEDIHKGDMQPDLCFQNRFYVTDATIPDESESIGNIPMWYERPKLFMYQGDEFRNPVHIKTINITRPNQSPLAYQIFKAEPRWDDRMDRLYHYLIFSTKGFHYLGSVRGYDVEFKEQGISLSMAQPVTKELLACYGLGNDFNINGSLLSLTDEQNKNLDRYIADDPQQTIYYVFNYKSMKPQIMKQDMSIDC